MELSCVAVESWMMARPVGSCEEGSACEGAGVGRTHARVCKEQIGPYAVRTEQSLHPYAVLAYHACEIDCTTCLCGVSNPASPQSSRHQRAPLQQPQPGSLPSRL